MNHLIANVYLGQGWFASGWFACGVCCQSVLDEVHFNLKKKAGGVSDSKYRLVFLP